MLQVRMQFADNNMFAPQLSTDQRLGAVAKIVPDQHAFSGVATQINGEAALVIGQRADGPGSWPITVSLFRENLTDSLYGSFRVTKAGNVEGFDPSGDRAVVRPDVVLGAVLESAEPCSRATVAGLLGITEEYEDAGANLANDALLAVGGLRGFMERRQEMAQVPDFKVGNAICAFLDGKSLTVEAEVQFLDDDDVEFVLAVHFENGKLALSARILLESNPLDLRSLDIDLVDSTGAKVERFGARSGSLEFAVEPGKTYVFRGKPSE